MRIKIQSFMLTVLLVTTCFNFTGCGKSKNINEAKTIKVIDCAGREVTVTSNIERIVDLELDGTKTLIQIGEEDKIVGLTDRALMSFKSSESGKSRFKWSVASKVAPKLKKISSVGISFREPNIEKIISLKPDVIFANIETKDKIEALEKQTGIPVVCMSNYTSLDFKMLKLIGKITGKEDKTNKIIAYSEKTINDITKVTSQIPENEKVKVFVITPSPLKGTELKTTRKYDPIDLAGGFNLAKKADVKLNTYTMSKEQIAVWNPDIILIMASYNGGGKVLSFKNMGGVNNILSDSILKTTNAVKNKKVYTYIGWDYGWDIATGVIQVPYMAKLFYPDKFKDLNIETKCNEIFKNFYGVEELYSETIKKLDLYNWKKGE